MASAIKQYGLIFVGGASTRMGQSKAHLKYHGVVQYQYLLDMFRELDMKAFLSCRAEQQSLFPEEVPCLVDQKENIGPMAGLLTAFDKYPQASWISVACDMPLLDANMIQQLINAKKPGYWAAAMRSPTDGKPEPFCAFWTPEAKPNLHSAYERGHYSLRELLLQPDVQHITPEQPQKLHNINTPDERNRFLNNQG